MLGVGTGELLNEVPATGINGRASKSGTAGCARRCVLMQQLWSEDRVTFEGQYLSHR